MAVRTHTTYNIVPHDQPNVRGWSFLCRREYKIYPIAGVQFLNIGIGFRDAYGIFSDLVLPIFLFFANHPSFAVWHALV